MTYVLENAREGYDERLALFNTPPVETAIQEIYYKDYRPVGQMAGNTALEFEVYNNSSDYILLSKIYLLLTLQLVTDKGTAIGATDNVGLINLPACSIFRQQDFAIQHQIITSSIGTNFAYKAILDALLKHGRSDELSWMSLGGFYRDTKGIMDDCTPKESPNNGLGNRYKLTASGKKVMLKTQLFMDICQQDRMLLNNLPLNIKLYPATDEFRLMYTNITGAAATTAKSYSVNIVDAKLVIPFVKIHPGMLTAQAELMKKEWALYPFTRSEIKAFNISTGSFNWTTDNLFQDSIPKRLVLAFMSSANYSGNNEKNPFNFANYGVNYLDFQVDGQSSGAQVLQPDYANDNYVVEYSKLFECMPPYQKEPPNITYGEFKEGYTLYVFDLEKSKDKVFTNPLKRGQTRLTVKFSAALSHPVTALLYGSFDALMKIDESRNVVVET